MIPSQIPIYQWDKVISKKSYFNWVYHSERVTSTNDVVIELIKKGKRVGPGIVVADYQTAGKGRFDRQWESPVAQDLLFSFIVKPATGIDQWSKITFPLGLAIRSALLDYVPTHYPIQLKWPNDILINNQKCAGMLASINVDMDILILGVGLNVNQIPTQMTRTSLAALSNQKLNRFQILQDVISDIGNKWNFRSALMMHVNTMKN